MDSPILIVGAGRSGTKLLRSVLASHPDLICFPREINYVWRHGNRSYPTDELTPDHARPEVAEYVRRRFASFSRGRGGRRLVEKTCANVLRVGFIHAVFPDAHVIHVVRDGRAVAESARRTWSGRPEIRYLLEKARWLPPGDIPYYAMRFLRYRLAGVGRGAERVPSSWGPRFSGIDEAVRTRPLIEVCGLQWVACVDAGVRGLAQLPPDRTTTVRYEDLVHRPLATTEALFGELGLRFRDECRTYVSETVHAGNVDKWQDRLSSAEQDALERTIGEDLRRHGYGP